MVRKLGGKVYCGNNHTWGACPAIGKICMACRKTGHFGKVCHSKPQTLHEVQADKIGNNSHELNNQTSEKDKLMAELFIGEIKAATNNTPDLWFVDVQVCSDNMHFRLDTGSEENILPKQIYKQIRATPFRKSTCMLVTFTRHHITPDGEVRIP